MKKVLVILLITISFKSFAQPKILPFQEVGKAGISIAHLDSTFKSAVHTNPDLAVFKTAEEQKSLHKAYTTFIRGIGAYLRTNNFKWDKPVRAFNRVYMAADGTVEYYIFQFSNQITAEKEKEFQRIVSLYMKDNKFPMIANEKFAQCSPVTYKD